jgi:hypothetical protein
MAFTFAHLCSTRPFLYHLTATSNLTRLRQTRVWLSAAALAKLATPSTQLVARRSASLELQIGGGPVHIRDQAPLHAGNIAFEAGWSFADLLLDLNRRVFFWPGTAKGPIAYGLRHFERYQNDDIRILRVPTEVMPTSVEVSFYNSGSPRCSGGLGSPRGPSTFRSLADADLPPSRVVEATWLDAVDVPSVAEQASSPDGPWHLL